MRARNQRATPVALVPEGWSAAAWRDRLLAIAAACAPLHPEKSGAYFGQAMSIAVKVEKPTPYPDWLTRDMICLAADGRSPAR